MDRVIELIRVLTMILGDNIIEVLLAIIISVVFILIVCIIDIFTKEKLWEKDV